MDEKDKIIEAQREEIRLLKQRLSELERRLGLNSETSSKPPSSDGLEKKNRPPLSGRGKNKQKGGQKGHKGDTLKQVENPDSTVFHKVTHCHSCQKDLSDIESSKITKRQVIDVEIRRHVVEHQAESKICSCGVHTTACFPEGITAPVQIGDQLKSIAIYLSGQFIAKDRLSEVMESLFETPISDTTLLKYELQLAKDLQPFYQQTHEYLKTASVKHSDETGMRVNKITGWMHVLSNSVATYLKYQPKRKVEYEGLSGTLVHDHYGSYLQLTGVTHAFCNAHILRELKSLMCYEKEPWAHDMHFLLQKMCHCKNEATLSDQKKVFFSRIYDKIIERGIHYHNSLPPLGSSTKRGRSKKRIGHNLLMRLKNFKDGTLLFMQNATVPFTNNQAEQDLRMVKVKQKISGCFRTEEGAHTFAAIRSYISTLRKNGGNVLDGIRKACSQQMNLHDILIP